MKICPTCKQMKPLEEFHNAKQSKDGKYPYCKACCKIRQADLYRRRDNTIRRARKVCPWCQTDLPRSAFRQTVEGKYHSRCAVCEDEIEVNTDAGLRRCNICREWLPQDRFNPSKLRFEHTPCRACLQAQVSQPKYRERRRAQLLMKEYGITPEQYDDLVARQGGNCPVCLEPLPPDRAGHVDHAHSGVHKGKIRAIVHGECNRTVLHDHEDSAILRRAADLIDNPLTDWVVPGLPSSEVRKEARKHRKTK